MGEELECLSIDEKSMNEVTTLGVKVGVKESFVARCEDMLNHQWTSLGISIGWLATQYKCGDMYKCSTDSHVSGMYCIVESINGLH